jgi:HPt (histidine-containing phosphotransfer) domain-containing protein
MFDEEFAIQQFSGNRSLLLQIIGKFLDQYDGFDTALKDDIKQDNVQAAKQRIHTIKGVSGNLGMRALYVACKDFEAELGAGITSQTLDDFLQVFHQTFALIIRFSEQNKSQESPINTLKQDDKTALMNALRRSEFISESKLQGYSKSLDLSQDDMNKLQQAINDLDYASAIQLLE